jgi:hypothetical protein
MAEIDSEGQLSIYRGEEQNMKCGVFILNRQQVEGLRVS